MNSYAVFHSRKDKLRMVKALRDEANRMERESEGMKAEFQSMPKSLGVTDHALVRFLERAVGIDVEAIREQIARLIPLSALPNMKSTDQCVLVVGNCQFVVSTAAVITVVTEDMGPLVGRALNRHEPVQISA